MEMLLTLIATWLSANFSLPAIYVHPEIRFASHQEILAVRLLQQPHESSAIHATPVAPAPSGIEALYDDRSRTIYLNQYWTGLTPAEMSILVHEMVHHLQNMAGLRYECAEAREELGYNAQDKYLALHGLSLSNEFKVDLMTRLVRTKCMH